MEIDTFEPRLDEETAVERTRNLSLGTYVGSWLADRLGRSRSPSRSEVYVVYYPDYIAYTSVTIRRALRGESSMKFLAGVDAVTGRIGEVDVDLPPRRTVDADDERVIEPVVSEAEAREIWREWLFEYVSRNYRAIKMPEYSLDELELVYTPYWIVDKGTLESSLAVSDLTRRTAKVEEIDVVAEFYRTRIAGRDDAKEPARSAGGNFK